MTDTLQFDRYVRKPFTVEAVLITEENLEMIADLVGQIKEEDGQRYIALNRKLITAVGRAYPGWYLTTMGDNLRCYNPDTFEEQFGLIPESGTVTFDFAKTSDDVTDAAPVENAEVTDTAPVENADIPPPPPPAA